jgi:hypothetical protein
VPLRITKGGAVEFFEDALSITAAQQQLVGDCSFCDCQSRPDEELLVVSGQHNQSFRFCQHCARQLRETLKTVRVGLDKQAAAAPGAPVDLGALVKRMLGL